MALQNLGVLVELGPAGHPRKNGQQQPDSAEGSPSFLLSNGETCLKWQTSDVPGSWLPMMRKTWVCSNESSTRLPSWSETGSQDIQGETSEGYVCSAWRRPYLWSRNASLEDTGKLEPCAFLMVVGWGAMDASQKMENFGLFFLSGKIRADAQRRDRLVCSLIWAVCWPEWPPEVPSDLNHSMTSWKQLYEHVD